MDQSTYYIDLITYMLIGKFPLGSAAYMVRPEVTWVSFFRSYYSQKLSDVNQKLAKQNLNKFFGFRSNFKSLEIHIAHDSTETFSKNEIFCLGLFLKIENVSGWITMIENVFLSCVFLNFWVPFGCIFRLDLANVKKPWKVELFVVCCILF